MDAVNVLKYQEALVEKYHYRPLPPMFRDEAHKLYSENLPDGFVLEGDNVPLFSPGGLRLCNRYNRIVVGDYGAYVEILPEDIINGNLMVKKGQEYRDADERYSKHTKYSWLTAKDGSNIKVYFQKKPVGYADYTPGRYYVSPFECSLPKVMEKDSVYAIGREKIADWLKKHGVFTEELLDYYDNVSSLHNELLDEAIERDLFPADFEHWMQLNEVCEEYGGLSYRQFEAVCYNLEVIDCRVDELRGRLPALKEDVQVAIMMGLEEFSVPYEAERLEPETVRFLLSLPAPRLLDIARLSKVLAGCKCESFACDLQQIIKAAEKRSSEEKPVVKEKELVL